MNIKKSSYVVCIAKIIAKKDKLAEVLEVFAKLKQKSPQEVGCLRYDLHQDLENPLTFTFIERYKDIKAFEFHCEQEYTKHYIDEVLPGLIESMEFSMHNEIELT